MADEEMETLKQVKDLTDYLKGLFGQWAKNFKRMEDTINKIEEDLHRTKQTVDSIESETSEILDKLAESALFADVGQVVPEVPKRCGREKV